MKKKTTKSAAGLALGTSDEVRNAIEIIRSATTMMLDGYVDLCNAMPVVEQFISASTSASASALAKKSRKKTKK